MGLWGDIKDAGGWVKDKGGDAWGELSDSGVGQALGLSATDAERRAGEFSVVDPSGRLQGSSQSAYRDAAYDRNNFRQGRFDQTQLIQGMQNRINGGQTVSGEMLRQGMHQNMAGQRSMAAGASATNSAMAARNAAMNSGRMNAGLAGQQAVAGMQERLASEQALGQMLQQRRQTDMQSMTDANNRGLRAAESIENARTSRVTGQQGPDQSSRLAGGLMAGMAAFSDKTLKKDIVSADSDAEKFINSISAYKYKYKNSKHGEGDQLGIMAQDLEKSGLGKQAVFDVGGKKAVHGAKLAGALAAVAAMQNKRIAKLEGKE